MKTYTHLWEKFISVDNFVKAYKNARKGKGKQRSVQEFKEGWALKLYALRKSVIDGNFQTSPYRNMTIYEPKKRTIYKLPFCPDRIIQHAIVNVLAPILERKFISDTYSCIPGRRKIENFIKTELKLEFSKSDVFSIRQGVDFCGYRHFDDFVLLRKSTKTRERRKIEEIKRFSRDGGINKNTVRASTDSILGWMRHAKTKNLKRSLDVLNLRQFISSI